MIETRGKEKIAVVSKSAVPVIDVCESVVMDQTLEVITRKFPVTRDEVFECMEFFLDTPDYALLPGRDFIKFTFDERNHVFDVRAITDILFMSLITYANPIMNNPDADLEELALFGLRHSLLHCLELMCSGKTTFRKNPLHSIIFDCMLEQIGDEAKWSEMLDILRKDLVIAVEDKMQISKKQ